MRLFVLALVVGGSALGCNDNEPIDVVVNVTDDVVRVEWSGPNVDRITLGESRGPSADAECDPGTNVWWAWQGTDADTAPALAPPFRIRDSDTHSAMVSATPILTKGRRYVVRLDRHETSKHARAHGCIGLVY